MLGHRGLWGPGWISPVPEKPLGPTGAFRAIILPSTRLLRREPHNQAAQLPTALGCLGARPPAPSCLSQPDQAARNNANITQNSSKIRKHLSVNCRFHDFLKIARLQANAFIMLAAHHSVLGELSKCTKSDYACPDFSTWKQE